MTDREMYELVGRVQNGLLCHATEEQIRTQLRTEGVSEAHINAAIIKGKRLAEVRLYPKEV